MNELSNKKKYKLRQILIDQRPFVTRVSLTSAELLLFNLIHTMAIQSEDKAVTTRDVINVKLKAGTVEPEQEANAMVAMSSKCKVMSNKGYLVRLNATSHKQGGIEYRYRPFNLEVQDV